MKNIQTGSTLKHIDGFIWTITDITGKWISLKTTDDFGNEVKAGMTMRDLKAVIKARYYSII